MEREIAHLLVAEIEQDFAIEAFVHEFAVARGCVEDEAVLAEAIRVLGFEGADVMGSNRERRGPA